MEKKLYPDSHVELKDFTARNYDTVMNIGTLGLYKGFLKKAIDHRDMFGSTNLDVDPWLE
jgi:hypothetical protein